MNVENKITRRTALGGLGATVVSLASAPLFAGETQTPSNTEPIPLENPVTKYPKPPFESQLQPWPGLASKHPAVGERNAAILVDFLDRDQFAVGQLPVIFAAAIGLQEHPVAGGQG